jgi:hypothetical protein
MRKPILDTLVVDVMFAVAALALASPSNAQYAATEIIDRWGESGGKSLRRPRDVAVDSSGNVYVAGWHHGNAFEIATPGSCSTSGTPCRIREIIDSTGDGGGNTLALTSDVAVGPTSAVYVTGFGTDNAFRIQPPRVPALSKRGLAVLAVSLGLAALWLARRQRLANA